MWLFYFSFAFSFTSHLGITLKTTLPTKEMVSAYAMKLKKWQVLLIPPNVLGEICGGLEFDIMLTYPSVFMSQELLCFVLCGKCGSM